MTVMSWGGEEMDEHLGHAVRGDAMGLEGALKIRQAIVRHGYLINEKLGSSSNPMMPQNPSIFLWRFYRSFLKSHVRRFL